MMTLKKYKSQFLVSFMVIIGLGGINAGCHNSNDEVQSIQKLGEDTISKSKKVSEIYARESFNDTIAVKERIPFRSLESVIYRNKLFIPAVHSTIAVYDLTNKVMSEIPTTIDGVDIRINRMALINQELLFIREKSDSIIMYTYNGSKFEYYQSYELSSSKLYDIAKDGKIWEIVNDGRLKVTDIIDGETEFVAQIPTKYPIISFSIFNDSSLALLLNQYETMLEGSKANHTSEEYNILYSYSLGSSEINKMRFDHHVEKFRIWNKESIGVQVLFEEFKHLYCKGKISDSFISSFEEIPYQEHSTNNLVYHEDSEARYTVIHDDLNLIIEVQLLK